MASTGRWPPCSIPSHRGSGPPADRPAWSPPDSPPMGSVASGGRSRSGSSTGRGRAVRSVAPWPRSNCRPPGRSWRRSSRRLAATASGWRGAASSRCGPFWPGGSISCRQRRCWGSSMRRPPRNSPPRSTGWPPAVADPWRRFAIGCSISWPTSRRRSTSPMKPRPTACRWAPSGPRSLHASPRVMRRSRVLRPGWRPGMRPLRTSPGSCSSGPRTSARAAC